MGKRSGIRNISNRACLRRTHPLPRDGTDCIQARRPTFEAKPLSPARKSSTMMQEAKSLITRKKLCCALPQKSDPTLGSGQYRERFYERAVKKKVFSMPPTVLGS